MKVGDYVRTECGIAKIVSFETNETIELDEDIMICNTDCYRNICTINQVIKSSPNVIDLIEEGDIVNGYYIDENRGEYLKTEVVDFDLSSIGRIEYITIYPKEIETILTYEQIDNIKYKVVKL